MRTVPGSAASEAASVDFPAAIFPQTKCRIGFSIASVSQSIDSRHVSAANFVRMAISRRIGNCANPHRRNHPFFDKIRGEPVTADSSLSTENQNDFPTRREKRNASNPRACRAKVDRPRRPNRDRGSADTHQKRIRLRNVEIPRYQTGLRTRPRTQSMNGFARSSNLWESPLY